MATIPVFAESFLKRDGNPAPEVYGNYIPAHLGKLGDMQSHGIIFQSDRELLYDFDGEHPMEGVHIEGGRGEMSSDYFMTRGRSLLWHTGEGGAIIFDAGLKLQQPRGNRFYNLSMGLFLASRNEREPAPSFQVELVDDQSTVRYNTTLYLHRVGWNLLTVSPGVPLGTRIAKIRLSRMSGPPVSVYLDNLMLGGFVGVETPGILLPVVYFERAESDASRLLLPDEREAFQTIADRILRPVRPIAHLGEATVKAYETWRNAWNIEKKGHFANGEFPLSYYRTTPGDTRVDSSSYTMYNRNQEFCGTLGRLGFDYASCQDPAQKARLRACLVDMVRLAVTYGGMPTAWYNGRGLVEGVYYGRDALEAEGLLGPISRQVIMQYGVDRILDTPPVWEKPPLRPELSMNGPEFIWRTSADDLNTGSKSTVLTVLLEPDSVKKATNLKKLSTWYSRVALSYAPNANGTLKPDGSCFHHWGNRFDNYGRAGFRGASDVLFWFSGTPFHIEREAHERLLHMGETFWKMAFSDGGIGAPDYFCPGISFSEIILNLARSGTPDGQSAVNPIFAGMFMGMTSAPLQRDHQDLMKAWKQAGILPRTSRDSITTLSYAGMQIRRKDDWALTIWGHSKDSYHTQYLRDGFLFYNIGGLGFVEENKKHAMWLDLKQPNLGGRGCPMDKCLAAGYHPSFAPCVTAVRAEWKTLGQGYYQHGSGAFSGGVSLGDHFGVYVQTFDAKSNPRTYGNTVGCDLAFRKTFFSFDQKVVALGRNIRTGKGQQAFTGVLQEPSEPTMPGVVLGGLLGAGKDLESGIPSETLRWAETAEKNLGVWFFPGQMIRREEGQLANGPRTGHMTRLYVEHGTNAEAGSASYGFIYTIRPHPGEMAAFASEMDSRSAPIRLLQDEDSLQVVSDVTQGATGYVFYKGGETHGTDLFFAADAPCLIMTQSKENGKSVALAVSDPNMHMEPTKENPYGYSMPAEIRITIRGGWILKETVATVGLPPPQVKVDSDGKGNTIIQVAVVDGLSTEMHLEKLGDNQ